jgi:hypothetical protein
LNCWRKFIDIIANNTKSYVAGIFFDDFIRMVLYVRILLRRAFWACSVMASASSRIMSLNAELLLVLPFGVGPKYLTCTGKGFDLFSDYVDTSVVTCIQFQYHLPIILAVDFSRYS